MKSKLEWSKYYVFEKEFSIIPLQEKDKKPALEKQLGRSSILSVMGGEWDERF